MIAGKADAAEQELFRAQMLTEMARMSVEDGLVMQIHPGSRRNHNRQIFTRFGRDVGADIPMPTDYVHALQPLLDRFGNDASLTLILFTLDESTYSRELAPLAGHYPCLRLGPPWWFYDSPEGMMRFRELTTETAGFYNTVGFNDDTRAFLSIPARHDVARRVDCAFLARLVAEHQLDEDEAVEVAHALGLRSGPQGVPAMSLYCREGGPEAELSPEFLRDALYQALDQLGTRRKVLAVPPDWQPLPLPGWPTYPICLRSTTATVWAAFCPPWERTPR